MPRPPSDDLPLTPTQINAVAAAALCNWRTVRSYLRGGRVLPVTAASIERSLEDLGHGSLVRGQAVA